MSRRFLLFFCSFILSSCLDISRAEREDGKVMARYTLSSDGLEALGA
jgi:hypothetical protein